MSTITSEIATSSTSLDLRGRRVVVMGLGRFGGGVGVTRFLCSRGADVLVTDKSKPDELRESVAKLADLPVKYRLGEHVVEDFAGADLIVVNPAVKPRDNPYLAAARAAGVPLTSEIRLLAQLLPNRLRTIGVTGSAGKSTTTAMIGHILSARGTSVPPVPPVPPQGPRVHIGGNLGGSLLSDLDRITPDDWVVLELSSFMLEGLREDRWSPHIALITNLSPNHLDWHDTFEAYRDAKAGIVAHQDPSRDIALLGPGVQDHIAPATQRVMRIEDTRADAADLPALLIPGRHNRLNAAMAIAVCSCAGVERKDAIAAVAGFTGLPHRLQFVAEHRGVRFFNDSKSTTPESAMLALKSFAPGTVHIILGGYDKRIDLSPLAAFARSYCKAIYTIGETGPTITAAAQAARGFATIARCETLDNALHAAMSNAKEGDIVLLSPACASWDQFTHFEQRGEAFVAGVLRVGTLSVPWASESSSLPVRSAEVK